MQRQRQDIKSSKSKVKYTHGQREQEAKLGESVDRYDKYGTFHSIHYHEAETTQRRNSKAKFDALGLLSASENSTCTFIYP